MGSDHKCASIKNSRCDERSHLDVSALMMYRNKFREGRQEFDAASNLMDGRDPRRRACVEHAKAAERKSNYNQSQEVHGFDVLRSVLCGCLLTDSSVSLLLFLLVCYDFYAQTSR